MKKDTLVFYLYIICCDLAEKNIPYKKAQEIMFQTVEGDIDVLDDLPEIISHSYSSTFAHINLDLEILTPQDKKIIVENLLKDTYLMISYIDKTYNSALSYIERERERYNLILKQVTISVLMDYIGKGENNKSVYNSFKEEYTKYCKAHIAKIAKMLDSKAAGIEQALKESQDAATDIANRYPSLNITSHDLRTVYETDLYFKNNNIPMTKEEQEMFNLVAV
jgi:hypothetical protein